MSRIPLTLTTLALVALLGACGSDEPAPAETSAPATATTEPAEVPSPTEATETSDEDEDRLTIELTVADGQVSGADTRTVVPLGSEVTISVLSDVDDEIHVHGYDHHQDVAAGEVSALSFTADIPGVFEIELEDAGLRLVEIEVR